MAEVGVVLRFLGWRLAFGVVLGGGLSLWFGNCGWFLGRAWLLLAWATFGGGLLIGIVVGRPIYRFQATTKVRVHQYPCIQEKLTFLVAWSSPPFFFLFARCSRNFATAICKVEDDDIH